MDLERNKRNGELGEGGHDGLDPRSMETAAEFGAGLSELTKGRVRGLAEDADVPRSTLRGWATGQHLPNPNQIAQFRRLLTALHLSDAEQEAWADAVLRIRRNPLTRRNGSDAPYRGLRQFEVDDADWYFGRDSSIARVEDHILKVESAPGARRLVVVGASGAGKSSLVRAGVGHRFRSGDSGRIREVVVTTPSRIAQEGLIHAGEAAGLDGPRPLVIIDQLEELFHPDVSEEIRAHLSAEMDRLSASPTGPTLVVAIRADQYERLLQMAGFEDALQTHQVIVTPMTHDELRQAIVEPARRSGISIEDELVQLMLEDFAPQRGLAQRADAGTLPLLSHALMETWSRARRRTMTVADYLALGGVRGAVQTTAEAAFQQLDDMSQGLARELFTRLVSIDGDGAISRRSVGLSELAGGDGAGGPGLTDVMYHFVDARLLTADATTVCLSHEALLLAWDRLREWVSKDRVEMSIHGELRDANAIWQSNNHHPSTLLGGGRLERIDTWAKDTARGRTISPDEGAFLAASRQRADRQVVVTRRRRRRLVAVAAVASLLALAAIASATMAVKARNQARGDRNAALSRRVALQADQLATTSPALATQLALVGYEMSRTVEARSALLDRSARGSAQRFVGGAARRRWRSAPMALRSRRRTHSTVRCNSSRSAATVSQSAGR